MDLRENTRAVVAMMAAMLAFIANDSIVKLIADRLPLGEIMFVRGCMAIVIVLAIAHFTDQLREFRHIVHWTVPTRAFGEVAATVLYLTALFNMPIANATAILQALPLMVTAGAAIFLGMPVGWRRWTAIAIGFAGVLLIVRPGVAGFNLYSLVALFGVVFMAMRDLVTRGMPKVVPTLGVTLATLVGVALTGLALSATETWIMPPASDLALLAFAAVSINIGFVCLIFSMRTGDVTFVAPFRYSMIVWAILLGYAVWGDVPDALTLAGTFVVVASGIYSFFRERSLALAGTRPVPSHGTGRPMEPSAVVVEGDETT
ncbi:DMT family transporter [Stappia sp. F7233]|uniref:DMT family transporter n=1 Tax=Stappia albiluteola TaxID=2758565 RepID=A0A839ACF8_9HYPH|nr:DMT family transporter [Stappia albiluteola]MBA5776622.1 DMT family transporter [Stappia albiluteola]